MELSGGVAKRRRYFRRRPVGSRIWLRLYGPPRHRYPSNLTTSAAVSQPLSPRRLASRRPCSPNFSRRRLMSSRPAVCRGSAAGGSRSRVSAVLTMKSSSTASPDRARPRPTGRVPRARGQRDRERKDLDPGWFGQPTGDALGDRRDQVGGTHDERSGQEVRGGEGDAPRQPRIAKCVVDSAEGVAVRRHQKVGEARHRFEGQGLQEVGMSPTRDQHQRFGVPEKK